MEFINMHFQKKIKFSLYCVFLVILLFLCVMYNKKSKGLIDGKIDKIHIETYPSLSGVFEDLNITEPDDINEMVNFFNGIYIKKTFKNLIFYGGMSYELVFYFDTKEPLEVGFFYNKYIYVNHQTYEIFYDKDQTFDKVIGKILMNKYNSKNYIPLIGKITDIFIEKDEEKREKVCMLDTYENKIYISCTCVYNIKENSWWYNDVHKGDDVEIYLSEGTQNAEVIFVKP